MKNFIQLNDKKIEISDETAKNLDKQFGEKPKPELRHGDYGYDREGIELLIAKPNYDESLLSFDVNASHCGIILNGIHATRTFTKLGNIFDDLKRNSEDLEEFEINDSYYDKCYFQITGHNKKICFNLIQAGNHPHFTLDQLDEIIQKLSQLRATAKRKQNAK